MGLLVGRGSQREVGLLGLERGMMHMIIHGDRSRWLHGSNGACIRTDPYPARALRLVLLGAPGAGKGTQAALIAERYGTCPLSTGDVFREAKRGPVATLDGAMKQAVELMAQGRLVPDETVVDLVRERGHCLLCNYGFILDGFPRTAWQAEALEDLLLERGRRLDAVLNYTLPRDIVIRRLSGRRTCADCKATYHLEDKPPAAPGKCDRCGGSLFQRSDDHPDAIAVRLQAYEESTAPLIAYYEDRQMLHNISADGAPSDVFARSRALLDSLADFAFA